MMNFFFQLSSVQRVVSVLLVMAVYVVLANQLFSPESFLRQQLLGEPIG